MFAGLFAQVKDSVKDSETKTSEASSSELEILKAKLALAEAELALAKAQQNVSSASEEAPAVDSSPLIKYLARIASADSVEFKATIMKNGGEVEGSEQVEVRPNTKGPFESKGFIVGKDGERRPIYLETLK